MTDKERIEIDLAINQLKSVRNNIPNVYSISSDDYGFYLRFSWTAVMMALKHLEQLDKIK